MNRINRAEEISIDTNVPLNVPRPTVTVGQLIEIVNFAYEENVINYWEIEYLEAKKVQAKDRWLRAQLHLLIQDQGLQRDR